MERAFVEQNRRLQGYQTIRLRSISCKIELHNYNKAQKWKVGNTNQTHLAGRLKNGKMLEVHFFEPLYPCDDKMSIKIFFTFGLPRVVERGGHRGMYSPNNWSDQYVVVPLQHFQQILGLTEWVPPQYLTPSHGPAFQ